MDKQESKFRTKPQVLLNGMPAVAVNCLFSTKMKPLKIPTAVIGPTIACKTPNRQVLINGTPVPSIGNWKPGA